MSTVYNVKVNTNQLNRALKEVSARVERVAAGDLYELSKARADEAREAFKNALYDGENDVVVSDPEFTGKRTVTIEITGEALPFIEYGTGAKRNSGYTNAKTNKPWWFFNANGRDIQLKAGGALKKRFHYKTTETREVSLSIMDGFGATGSVRRSDPRFRDRDGKLSYLVGGRPLLRNGSLEYVGGREIPVRRVTEEVKLDKPERIEDGTYTDKFITSGNPPQYIVQEMREKLTDDLYKRFKARFK